MRTSHRMTVFCAENLFNQSKNVKGQMAFAYSNIRDVKGIIKPHARIQNKHENIINTRLLNCIPVGIFSSNRYNYVYSIKKLTFVGGSNEWKSFFNDTITSDY